MEWSCWKGAHGVWGAGQGLWGAGQGPGERRGGPEQMSLPVLLGAGSE